MNRESVSLNLMAAADKYDVPDLFRKCQLHLAGQVTVENSVEYYLASYLHDATILKHYAMLVMVVNYQEVKETVGFSMVSQNPKALLHILEKVLITPKKLEKKSSSPVNNFIFVLIYFILFISIFVAW